jgi:hypothetical protein
LNPISRLGGSSYYSLFDLFHSPPPSIHRPLSPPLVSIGLCDTGFTDADAAGLTCIDDEPSNKLVLELCRIDISHKPITSTGLLKLAKACPKLRQVFVLSRRTAAYSAEPVEDASPDPTALAARADIKNDIVATTMALLTAAQLAEALEARPGLTAVQEPTLAALRDRQAELGWALHGGGDPGEKVRSAIAAKQEAEAEQKKQEREKERKDAMAAAKAAPRIVVEGQESTLDLHHSQINGVYVLLEGKEVHDRAVWCRCYGISTESR